MDMNEAFSADLAISKDGSLVALVSFEGSVFEAATADEIASPKRATDCEVRTLQHNS